MGTHSHRIFSQQWQVSVSSEAEAFILRKQIRERWEDTIVPVFDRAFNEYSKGDEILYIPKLEINLKVTIDKDLWESIRSGLYFQLSEILGSKKCKIGHSQSNTQFSEIQRSKRPETNSPRLFNQLTEMPGSANPEIDELFAGESGLIRISAKLYRFEVLIHYLQNGNLPWQENSSVHEASKELVVSVREYWLQLIDFLHNYKVPHAFLFRLFQFLSDDEIILLSKDLCSHLSFTAKEELNNLIIALLTSGENGFNTFTRRNLSAAFIEAGIRHDNATTVPDWFEKTRELIPQDKLNEIHRFCTLVPGNVLLTNSLRPGIKGPLNTGKNFEHDKVANVNQHGDAELTSDFLDLCEVKKLLPKAWEFSEYPDFQGKISSEVAFNEPFDSGPFRKLQKGMNFMVRNAGLLLLHPFIVSFFVQTGILAVNEWEIPGYNLSNAAALLHYLATGREDVYEFELGFIKILLGLEPDQSLPVSAGTLTIEQKNETESLLTSVVGYWTTLKNTSSEGLRISFIQRPAIICETEAGWRVQPESNSYDLLIGSIPWGFSIIKLPWMEKTIYTEWQTN